MTLEPIPPSPEGEDIFGGWLETAATIGRFIAHLPGLPGGSVVIDLLAALTDAQDSQTGLLKSIKSDTATLVMNPFRVAMQSLKDAQRVGPAHPSWDISIRRAEDKFIEASKNVSGPDEEALVEFNLTIVYLTMGDEVNARYHAEQSVQCADRAVNEYVRRSGTAIRDSRTLPAERRSVGPRARDVGIVAAVLGTVAITNGMLSPSGAYLDAMTPRGRRACRDLERFIGFYNLIQRTASSISGDAQPRYLVLSGPHEPLVKGLFKKPRPGFNEDCPYVLYTSSG